MIAALNTMQVIFVHTHPVQYFAPLYKYLAQQNLSMQVWYCANGSTQDSVDPEFGTKVVWDQPLLDGYEHVFFENKGKASRKGRGWMAYYNPDMLVRLAKEPPSLLVIHGWNYRTYTMLLRYGRQYGHRLAFRGETNLQMEMERNTATRMLRKVALRNLLAPVHFFFYIGNQSHRFYKYLGIQSNKLIHTPYAVDNQRFQQEWQRINKDEVRAELGIPQGAFVILFSGKYIPKKRPLDLLKAFAMLNVPHSYLLLMGEGELRHEMEKFIDANLLSARVCLTGFVNQSKVSMYYRSADVFVMCSDFGETWGLSVNEAMNFSLPIVVSNRTGCCEDLLENGVNGYSFPAADIKALSRCLQHISMCSPGILNKMGQSSLDIINRHSFVQIHHGLLRALSS